MSDAQVKYDDQPQAYAGRLLAAARELGLPTNVVVFSPDGYFTVPSEVADKAGASYDMLDAPDAEPTAQVAGSPKPEPPTGDGDQGVDQGAGGDKPPADPEPAKAPKKNAARDAWAAYAGDQGAPQEETKPQDEGGLSRADLIKKYAPKE